jgi:hypothetical protein
MRKITARAARRLICLGAIAGILTAATAWAAEKPPAAPATAAAQTAPVGQAPAKAMDAGACRDKGLAGEKAGDPVAALEAWERVIDRCPASEEQRVEARSHIAQLRPKVPRNTDPAKAHSWKVLVVIFRHLEFSWADGDKTFEAAKTVSPEDEKKIRSSIEAFGQHVFLYSSGLLRVDATFAVIDEPLKKLGGKGKGPFAPAPHLTRWAIDPLIAGKQYDTVLAYVKFNGDTGPSVPAQFIAGTYGSIPDVNGAGFISVCWHTNYPLPGETNGEMELHEWLHQIEWVFIHVLRYPKGIVSSSDSGRMEGDNRPGGDTEYARKKTETTWIRFYQHIMEDHITRQMWSEATLLPPLGRPLPGDLIKK